VQRELSAPTVRDTRRSLVLNGIARFPLTLLYVFLGLAVGAVAVTSPSLAAAVPADEPDALVPQFIMQTLPSGIRGLLFAAILAAAMSSLDSALNSLSAATMRDFVAPFLLKGAGPKAELKWSKVVTVIWGAAITALAFAAKIIPGTIVTGINKVGSAFYGPILAAFLVGILSKRTTGGGVIAGVVAGVLFNVGLWIMNIVLEATGLEAHTTYWMWWNVTGLVVTVIVAVGWSRLSPPPDPARLEGTTLSVKGLLAEERKYVGIHISLIAYFFVILLVVLFARQMLEAMR
jgi:SSS family solute:Na+ symporter